MRNGSERPTAATRRRTAWPFAIAAVAIALLVGTLLTLAWLGGEPEPRPTTSDPVGVVGRLCATVGAARANNRIEASRVFLDKTDDRLRRLAARVDERDPVVAARLRRAEERVADNLESPQPALEGDLLRLVAATRRALRVVGDPVPARCPPEEEER